MAKRIKKISSLHNRIIKNKNFFRVLKPPFPKNMLIEITNACNNKCVFCSNPKMTRKIHNMDKEFCFRILKEAYLLGTKEVGFYSTGEPLLIKNLSKYVAKAKAIGYKYTYITTNGILATPNNIIPIIKSGLDSIKFSINAGNRKTYKEIHGTDNFFRVISNLKFIADYRKKCKVPLKLYASYIITRQNKKEIYVFEKLVAPLVDEIIFANVENQGGHMINKGMGDEPVNSIKKHCGMVFNRFHITAEGYLTICCVDFNNHLVVADLNNVSLRDAWNNDMFINMRRKHLDNTLEGTICYNCTIPIFKGASKFRFVREPLDRQE